jgi:lipoate-protein ligase B
MRAAIAWKWLGLYAYEDALALQHEAWSACRTGGPDICLALEHPPTITFGRRATAADVVASSDELARRGIGCHTTERGGRATYHAPGQLVLYPIVTLAARGLGVERFVWMLEEIMLAIAAAAGVRAHRDERGRGIWTTRGKLGAVGIRVRDGITSHGLALNVCVDLAGFDLIAPCGTRGLPVTSLAAEGARIEVLDVLPAAERACARVFGTAESRVFGTAENRGVATAGVPIRHEVRP